MKSTEKKCFFCSWDLILFPQFFIIKYNTIDAIKIKERMIL